MGAIRLVKLVGTSFVAPRSKKDLSLGGRLILIKKW